MKRLPDSLDRNGRAESVLRSGFHHDDVFCSVGGFHTHHFLKLFVGEVSHFRSYLCPRIPHDGCLRTGLSHSDDPIKFFIVNENVRGSILVNSVRFRCHDDIAFLSLLSVVVHFVEVVNSIQPLDCDSIDCSYVEVGVQRFGHRKAVFGGVTRGELQFQFVRDRYRESQLDAGSD